MEAAENIAQNVSTSTVSPLEYIETPNCKTIEDVCNFLEKISLHLATSICLYSKEGTN